MQHHGQAVNIGLVHGTVDFLAVENMGFVCCRFYNRS